MTTIASLVIDAKVAVSAALSAFAITPMGIATIHLLYEIPALLAYWVVLALTDAVFRRFFACFPRAHNIFVAGEIAILYILLAHALLIFAATLLSFRPPLLN